MIRNILFDLGNVLVPVDRAIAYYRLGPFLPPERARLLEEDRAAFDRLFQDPLQALETGRIDFARFRLETTNILGIRVGADEFHRIWCDMFRLDVAMVALGELLSERYATWLASNTSRVHYEWILERFPRIAFYRKAALSYELGVMKPAAAYYERTIALLSIDAAESVFIDDLEENVSGAVRAGMNGILFRGREALVEELRHLGVEAPDEGSDQE